MTDEGSLSPGHLPCSNGTAICWGRFSKEPTKRVQAAQDPPGGPAKPRRHGMHAPGPSSEQFSLSAERSDG